MNSDEPRTQDWNESLADGVKWEQKLEERLEKVLMTTALERISFEDDPEAQLSGIDMVLSQESPKIDVKSRSYIGLRYDDILIETWSVWEEQIPGWFYTTEADLIARVYENEPGTNLTKGYFIVMSDTFDQWFRDNYEDYDETFQHTVRGDEEWHSAVREVPIEDFPQGTLVEFDPTLYEPTVDSQQDLSGWL